MSKITATLAATATATAALFASNLALADSVTREQVRAELTQAWADGTVSIASLGANGDGHPLFNVKKSRAVDVKAPVVVSQEGQQSSKQ